MKRLYIPMAIAVLAIWAAAVLLGKGSLSWFFDLPSLVLVLFPAFFLSLGVFGFREIGRAFSVGFRKEGAVEADLRKALVFFEALPQYLILSGLLGTLLGVMTMMRWIDDLRSMGSGMALALLTVVYSLILTMVLVVPFRSGIRRKLAEAGKAG